MISFPASYWKVSEFKTCPGDQLKYSRDSNPQSVEKATISPHCTVLLFQLLKNAYSYLALLQQLHGDGA
jgi:hypothetical protein